MAPRTDGETGEEPVGIDTVEPSRYAGLSLGDGAVIIYDTEDESRWIQSTSAVALDQLA